MPCTFHRLHEWFRQLNLFQRLWLAYTNLDLSPKVEVVRYALNRAIDVFVIGPASIAVFLVFAAWVSGTSPTQLAATAMAEEGEMFRGAPKGYVFVVDMPAPQRADVSLASPPPALLSPAELDSRPKRLIPLAEWERMQAETIGSVYLSGIVFGVFVIVTLRGFRLLRGPFFAGADTAPR